jgi:hypothetical protein
MNIRRVIKPPLPMRGTNARGLSCPARSNDEIKAWAKHLLKYFGVKDQVPVDVVGMLHLGKILTPKGEKRLEYRVRPDEEMGEDDATTIHGDDKVIIDLKKSVYRGASVGIARHRNTIAHELCHSARFLVSKESAKIYWDQLNEARNRSRTARAIRDIANRFLSSKRLKAMELSSSTCLALNAVVDKSFLLDRN